MHQHQYRYVSEIHHLLASHLILPLIHTYHPLYHLILVGLLPLEPASIHLLLAGSLGEQFAHFAVFCFPLGILQLFLDLCHLREGLHDDREEEIQQEEGAQEDHKREVERGKEAGGIHVVVHDLGPAFQSNHSEDGQDANTYVIEMQEAKFDGTVAR